MSKVLTHIIQFIVKIILILVAIVLFVFGGIPMISGVVSWLESTNKPSAQKIQAFAQTLQVGSLIAGTSTSVGTDNGGISSANKNLYIVTKIEDDFVYKAPLHALQLGADDKPEGYTRDIDAAVLNDIKANKNKGLIQKVKPEFLLTDTNLTTNETKAKLIAQHQAYPNAVYFYSDEEDDRPFSKVAILQKGELRVYVNYYGGDELAPGSALAHTSAGVKMELTKDYSFHSYVGDIVSTN